MVKQIVFVLLTLKGRIRRNQFWLAWILVLVFGFGMKEVRDQLGQVFFFITYLYLVVAIYGKRLHDLGKSAWKLIWPIGLHGLSILSVIVINSYSLELMFRNDNSANLLFTLAAFLGIVPTLIWFAFALFIGLPHGETGDNRFGADPRAQNVIAGSPGFTRAE